MADHCGPVVYSAVMALRASLSLVCLLGVTAACATGASPEDNGVTFGVGAASTQAMASGDSSDSGTTGGDDDGTADDGQPGGPGGPGSDGGGPDADGEEVGGPACGNGMLDVGEPCDGADLGGADCVGEGFAGGTLACTPQCMLDTGGCLAAVCGDGIHQRGEQCDCGGAGSACSPAQLADQSCTTLSAPTGGNYSGGTLGCTAQCAFDESGCTACGDGTIDPGETCDGANLGGQTCISMGFDTGTLACAPNCTFNTGGCVDYFCGNGTCDPGEDSCSCGSDCPDDPNSCAIPCECGSSGGNCYCDAACVSFGDCCFNGPC